MRRLPVYFVLDISESMVGEPIAHVQEGMRRIIQDLRNDPYALETVYVSVIAFAGKAACLSPLEELYKFYPPELPIGDGTSLGEALTFLMKDMDRSLQKTTMEAKGDWKPIIFLFTDGIPTDDPSKAIKTWNKKYRQHCNMVAVSIGDGADTYVLGQLTDSVLRLNETDSNSFTQFFKWVTASIKTSSMSVSDAADDGLKLAPTTGINLEKVDTREHVKVDENCIVLLGKCTKTKKLYLVKYGKPTDRHEAAASRQGEPYTLVGAYAIDAEKYETFSGKSRAAAKVNSDAMMGIPTCPCCGNQDGVIVCGACSKVSCCGDESVHVCPWCGNKGKIVSANSFDVARERG